MCKDTNNTDISKQFSRKSLRKFTFIMEATNNMDKQQTLLTAFSTLRRAGIVKTWKDFAELLEVNRTCLSAAKNGQEAYLTDNLISKVTDLVNQYKESGGIQITHSPHTNVATGNSQITIGTGADQQPQEDMEMVPVIPTYLYKESDVNILEYVNDEDNDVHMTPAVQQFPKTDLIYSVQTMAMYPHLHQGDLLALKAIRHGTPIINGEMYAVDTKDNGILIRFIYDRGDSIEMRASEKAERFEAFRVNKSDIFTIFRVVGMIRTNI